MTNQKRFKMCFEMLFIGLRYLRFLTILWTIINRGLFVLSLNYQKFFFFKFKCLFFVADN